MVGSGSFCAVANCTNSWRKSRKECLNLSFFSIPKDPALRKEWIIKCRRKDAFNPDTAHLCSAHFTEEDFESDLQAVIMGVKRKRFLVKTAIPSRNLPIDHATPSTPAAKRRRERSAAKVEEQKRQDAVASTLLWAHDLPSTPQPVDTTADEPSVSEDAPVRTGEEAGFREKFEQLNARFDRVILESQNKSRIIMNLKQSALREKRRVIILNALLKSRNAKVKELETKLKKVLKTQKFGDKALTSPQKVSSPNEVQLATSPKKMVKWTTDEIGKAFTLRYLN